MDGPERPLPKTVVADALRAHLDDLLTEPMPLSRLAEYFGVGRNKMREMVRRLEGVEIHGTLYRVPLRRMPPRYHLEHGLLPPPPASGRD